MVPIATLVDDRTIEASVSVGVAQVHTSGTSLDRRRRLTCANAGPFDVAAIRPMQTVSAAASAASGLPNMIFVSSVLAVQQTNMSTVRAPIAAASEFVTFDRKLAAAATVGPATPKVRLLLDW